MKWLMIAALFLAAACEPLGSGVTRTGEIPSEPFGGDINAFADAVRAHNGPARLTGRYVSAGTLWIGHPAACTVDDAQFVFHGPTFAVGVPLTEPRYSQALNYIARFYPEPTRAWYLATYATPGRATTKTGRDLIADGTLTHCDDWLMAVEG